MPICEFPLHDSALLFANCLSIKELVAKIIALEMRNIKKQNARAAEDQSESQPEEHLNLPLQDQESPLPSHIVDLEDFNEEVSNGTLKGQSKGKENEATVKKEVQETNL